MKEVICVVTGFVVGGFFGVVIMSILQINKIYQYEGIIFQLKSELEEHRRISK